MKPKRTVIFAHGFGVLKDARGMFTEIAEALSVAGINCILIDLNTIDADKNVVVKPFSKQVEILTQAYFEHKETQVDLIAHSQGCVIVALANLSGIRKTVFLAPPIESHYSKTIDHFIKNPLTTIDMEGMSRLARSDGSLTIVPSEYWQEREELDLKKIYKDYTAQNDVYIVKALQDEIISNDEIEAVFEDATLLELEANHNFTEDSRKPLISLCEKLVNDK